MTMITDVINGTINLDEYASPSLVIVTVEQQCNLACMHCYWHHEKVTNQQKVPWPKAIAQIIEWDAEVLYVGRVLTKEGKAFIQEYCSHSGKQVGVVDNGYSIVKHKDIWKHMSFVDISIDGVAADHDKQRGKKGAAKKAWQAVKQLQDADVRVQIASCISPLNSERWSEFESHVADIGAPLTCTPVLGASQTKAREMPLFSPKELSPLLEKLLTGIPKLLKLYDAQHVQATMPILQRYKWVDNGESVSTTLDSGLILLFAPFSIAALMEVSLIWDGRFYTSHDVEEYGGEKLDSTWSKKRVLHALHKHNPNDPKILKQLLQS